MPTELGLGPPGAWQAGMESLELVTSARGTLEMGLPAVSPSPAPAPLATGLPILPPRAEAAPAPPDGRPGARPCPPPRTLPPGPQSPVGCAGGGDLAAPAPPASHSLSCPEPGRQEVSEPGRGGGVGAGSWG